MPEITFNQGYVTAKDRADLDGGEMQQATGIYYKPGNRINAHKIGGRSTFGDTGTAAAVTGLAVAQFDSGGNDKVLALSSGALYGATPGATGTFASLYSLSGSGTTLDYAHANDRYYLAMDSENQVLESAGTVRDMGMQPPAAPPTLATDIAGSTDLDPTGSDAGWTDMANGYDGDENTSSYATRSSAGSTAGTWTFAAGTASGYTLQILYALQYAGDWGGFFGLAQGSGALVRLKVEITENDADYTEILNRTTNNPVTQEWLSYNITDSTPMAQFKVRATLTYVIGAVSTSFRIYDIRVVDGGTSNTHTASDIKYAYTEYAEDSDFDPGGESVPSEAASTGAFTDQASVTVTLPASALNSRATHFIIYRTPDNGTLEQLGRVGIVPVGQTTFLDTFEKWGTTEQAIPTVAYVEYEADGQKIRTPRDFPPPPLKRVFYYRGGLVGLSSVRPRSIFYSVQGLPESWPQEYFIDAIPLEERDELVDGIEIGGTAIIAAKGAMIRIDEFPRSIGGVFTASEAVAIKGAPGCVGPDAMVAVNYRGQSHAAWLSPENGILVTDGHQWDSIGDDIDWTDFDGFDKSAWCLTYYKHLRIIRMDYSSVAGGTNDRFLLFHIDKHHVKEGGRAKVTGPHYGKSNKTVSSLVSATTRVYTAHTSNGIVYLDHNNATGADSSNAYDGSGTHPMILKGARRYEEGWRSYTALAARLYHGDFGGSQTATVDYLTGRDSTTETDTRTQTVSLTTNKGTQFDIARAGEFHEVTITHTGTGLSYLGSMRFRARIQGDEGNQVIV